MATITAQEFDILEKRIQRGDRGIVAWFDKATTAQWFDFMGTLFQGLIISKHAGTFNMQERAEVVSFLCAEESKWIRNEAKRSDIPTAQKLKRLLSKVKLIVNTGDGYKAVGRWNNQQVMKGFAMVPEDVRKSYNAVSDTKDAVGTESQGSIERVSFIPLDNPLSKDGGTTTAFIHDMVPSQSPSPEESVIDGEFLPNLRQALQKVNAQFAERDFRYVMAIMEGEGKSKQACMNAAKASLGEKKAYQTDVYSSEDRIKAALLSMGITEENYFSFLPKSTMKESRLWESSTMIDRSDNNK